MPNARYAPDLFISPTHDIRWGDIPWSNHSWLRFYADQARPTNSTTRWPVCFTVPGDVTAPCAGCIDQLEDHAWSVISGGNLAEYYIAWRNGNFMPEPEVEPEEEAEEEVEDEEDEEELPQCHICRYEIHEDDYTSDDEIRGETVHESCWSEVYFYCDYCEAQSYTDESYGTPWGDMACEVCFYDRYSSCSDCGEVYSIDEMYEDGYGDLTCRNCDRNNIVHAWNWRPKWIYYELPKQTLQKYVPYFGLEIEISARNDHRDLINWYKREAELNPSLKDLMFMKDDSSIQNGYELVTHPMTFEWAKDGVDWEMFNRLLDNYDVGVTHNSCGGHVHINKDSFTNAHMWKFLQFHWRLGDFAELMGGRNSDQWGSFKGNFADQRARAKAIAMAKNDRYSERYSAVNLINDHTVELRYPAGGWSPEYIKKNLQLAHSIWTFTHELDSQLIREGILDDSGYFLWWVREHKDDYPELVDFINRQIPEAKPFGKETN